MNLLILAAENKPHMPSGGVCVAMTILIVFLALIFSNKKK